MTTIHWLDKSIRPSSSVGMVGTKYNWWIQGDISAIVVHNTQGTILNQRIKDGNDAAAVLVAAVDDCY